MIKVFSMFSGLGGFELGIELTGIKHQLVGFCEIDKYAVDVFKKHYKGVKHYEDATEINTGELPDFDLLVAGFPCQAFSVAGKGGGELDTRGTLYHQVLRVLQDKRPRYFVLENVKGLLTKKHRRTFVAIIKGLTNLGYNVEWALLNSANTGVPQNRERVYITGCIGTRGARGILSIFTGTEQDTQCIIQLNKPRHSNDRVYSTNGLAPTLNTMQGGRRQPIIYEMVDDRIRLLTPLECERIQGLPDGWTEVGNSDKKISKTQRYKMIGNSVTPQVVRDVVLTVVK